MNDDAVSPVVAAMLVLAVIVTFFAAWNALYVPSMKAQSEITHLQETETGVLRFSSDIETAASLKRNIRLSEQIPLGGGDFTFDTVKSGGTLRIRNESQGYLRLTINKIDPKVMDISLMRLANFSYEPVSNFWQDQGYTWAYGNMNVTKGPLSTPLQYTDMESVPYGLTGTLFDLELSPSPTNTATCPVMNVYTVNIRPEAGHSLASGNGRGSLVLESTVTNRQFANATSMIVEINRDIPAGFRDALWESVNRNLESSAGCVNIHTSPDYPNRQFTVVFDSIPNMTLSHRTTEIALAAY